QVLDDGRLTDNKGRVVNFKNTIIIMTSNLGSDYIQEKSKDLTSANSEEWIKQVRQDLTRMLKQVIRPEFINRIDETVVFLPLRENEIEQIVRLQVDNVVSMLEANGIVLQVDDSAVNYIAKTGYDPEFGARPVKRAIQSLLLNELSTKLLSDSIDKQKPIIISAKDDVISFSN
ncbi:MAG: AAA family ATPase, partial [Bacteroidaceae bacterium]|nr:AAA family ATPase [Bacteroidaceae bacterium]